jgi:hypothetical protein
MNLSVLSNLSGGGGTAARCFRSPARRNATTGVGLIPSQKGAPFWTATPDNRGRFEHPNERALREPQRGSMAPRLLRRFRKGVRSARAQRSVGRRAGAHRAGRFPWPRRQRSRAAGPFTYDRQPNGWSERRRLDTPRPPHRRERRMTPVASAGRWRRVHRRERPRAGGLRLKAASRS